MSKPIFNYDEMSDTLYVSFSPGEKATGIELNDHILLLEFRQSVTCSAGSEAGQAL